jgi:hypothetical protein
MRHQGWSTGERWDPDRRTHDALVPFERLGEEDRQTVLAAVRLEKLQERLAGMVDYPRGPERPLVIAEMKMGLRVLADSSAPNIPAPMGRVIGWETSPSSGGLELVRVRWENGQVTRHAPLARELRRVE